MPECWLLFCWIFKYHCIQYFRFFCEKTGKMFSVCSKNVLNTNHFLKRLLLHTGIVWDSFSLRVISKQRIHGSSIESLSQHKHTNAHYPVSHWLIHQTIQVYWKYTQCSLTPWWIIFPASNLPEWRYSIPGKVIKYPPRPVLVQCNNILILQKWH